MRRRPATAEGCSIRVVVRRTGLSADTLRMWERRYGFPKPARRAGGSRIYSEDDVARLLLVTRALAAGYRPGEVVPASRAELERIAASSPAAVVAAPPDTRPFDVGAIVEALANDELDRVRQLLRASAVTLGPRAFVTELAQPLAVRIGELWEKGELAIRHEHVASALLATQLRLLSSTLEDGARGPVVVLATLPGERHALPLDMIAVYLATGLAAPRILGEDSPVDEIVATARAISARAVGLSISGVADARVSTKRVRAIARDLPKGTELWLGGAGAERVDAGSAVVRTIRSWPELDRALDSLRARTAA